MLDARNDEKIAVMLIIMVRFAIDEDGIEVGTALVCSICYRFLK
ncbi:MAG: hypothetical protein ACLTAI_10165 [Thomasclavelia sp.]